MSRLVLILVAVGVGLVLAVGATLTTSALITKAPTPSNQTAYNYGS